MVNYIQFLSANKSFSAIIFADLVSSAGDILFSVALSWTVLETTRSVFMASLVLFLQYISKAVCSVFSGLLIDRFSRKRLFIYGLLIQAGLLIIFMPVLGGEHGHSYLFLIPLLLLLYFFSTIVSQTQNVMIPDVVATDELVLANSLDIILNRVVGVGMMAVAGILTAILQITSIMLIDVFSFVIAAALLAVYLREPGCNVGEDNDSSKRENQPVLKKGKWLTDLHEGWQYIKTDEFVRVFLLMVVLLNLPYSVMNLFPLAYSNKVLGAGAAEYGILKAVIFVATLVSMFIIGRYKIFREKPALFFTLGIFGAGLSMFFFSPFFHNNHFTVVLLFFAYEFCDSVTQPIYAIFRGRIPSVLRGRVMGLSSAILLAAVPAYTLLAGWAMDALGTTQVGAGVAVLFIVLGIQSIRIKLDV